MAKLWIALVSFYFSVSYGAHFNLQDLFSSKSVSIDTEGAKPQLYLFLSSQCPCSRSYTDYLSKLSKKYKNIDFTAVVANQNEDLKKAKNYFRDRDLKFPVYFDVKAQLANHLKALKTPHVFLVNTSGNILYSGAVADSREIDRAKNFFLDKALNEFREGKNISQAKTRSLGCYIVR